MPREDHEDGGPARWACIVYEEHRPLGAPPEPDRTLAWLETMMGHGLTADDIGEIAELLGRQAGLDTAALVAPTEREARDATDAEEAGSFDVDRLKRSLDARFGQSAGRRIFLVVNRALLDRAACREAACTYEAQASVAGAGGLRVARPRVRSAVSAARLARSQGRESNADNGVATSGVGERKPVPTRFRFQCASSVLPVEQGLEAGSP